MEDNLMESRGQKRSEMGENLPADKRACNSFEFRASSSRVVPEIVVNTAMDTHDGDMETSSSSASASGRSEGDGERDSPYGSCDSDDMNDVGDHRYRSLRALQRSRAYGDSAKHGRILSSLSNDNDVSGQLAALTELCELLSFSTEDSESSMLADQLGPSLVKLANHESNPDIMLLSIRAITYLCDIFPRSSRFLVRHNAVPALCQRLLIIEYLDVAEQCLQALEKISKDQPLVCLQSGALMAVLGYIDFFSTSVQRTALSVVVNVCKKLPSENPPLYMEAVPRLCNLLQYEDQQLVELVASSLIKIVDRVKDSSEMLNELYGHGLIHQATHLLALNSRITLSQPIYSGLIGLVAKLASGSADAVRALFELNIGSIIKDVLTNSDLSHGMPSPRTLDKNCIQVHEILKLLHELLPEGATGTEGELLSNKQRILLDEPDRLRKFGVYILPTLVQVVNSGASLYVCHGCLSIINKLVYFSEPETLHELLKGINIASFLAGVFTWSDHHVLLLALQIAQTVLEKLSNILMNSFVKEGVFFAMDALTSHNGCSQFTFLTINGIRSPNSTGKGSERCMCQPYVLGQLGESSESKTCNISEDSVQNLAQHLKNKYFPVELNNSQSVVTDVLKDLTNASAAITDLLKVCPSKELKSKNEEKLHTVLSQVILRLCGDEPISTFELIESGIIKALLNYLSDGQYLSMPTLCHGVQKRFETFATISLSSSSDTPSKDMPLSLLVRRLQSALSTVESFPVIGGYAPKQRGSYATIPNGRVTMYSCIRVSFRKGEEEDCLGDYSVDAATVDPFCSVKEIEQYLRTKVIQKGTRASKLVAQASSQVKTELAQVPLATTSLCGKSMELIGSSSMSNPLPYSQERADGRSSCSSMETSDSVQPTLNDTKIASNGQSGLFDEELPSSERTDNHTNQSLQNGDSKEQCRASSSIAKVPLKLALYLEGEQLDYSSTLYQEILQRRIKSQQERHIAAKLWSDTYTVTYKRAGVTENGQKEIQELFDNDASDKTVQYQQVMPLMHKMFSPKLGPNLDLSGPTTDILSLLRSLEMMNSFGYHLVSFERMNRFAKGKIHDLDHLKARVPKISQYEFVNVKLTDKLEQQMREPSAVHVGAMPLWCSRLMAWCPFIFSFDARLKYFHLSAFGRSPALPSTPSFGDSDVPRERRSSPVGNLSRKKFLVCRDSVLESASRMMDLYARKKVPIEVEYSEEVGTGLGPTLEFYTLVSREFQKPGLGMWRCDYLSPDSHRRQMSNPGFISTIGLFPRPWSHTSCNMSGIEFSEVTKKFVLLGQIVGKAIQDGRVLDIPFSQAFYKLVIGKDLSLCDIESFDPELGRSLVEFQALVNRRKCIEFTCEEDKINSGFRDTKIEDLCLGFTLPGYPDYVLASGMDDVAVNDNNLEEYISLVLDATLYTGITRQVEAFKSGLNQVISDKYLQLFTEEELEHLLCGECDSWVGCDLLDHIKFDHGYTAGSPQILNLLEVISEFNYDERRSFLQFVTGAPRLPPGGLAALNPKLTIVRKQHSGNGVDLDLPSVMTCANYLKLPPYSSKERLKEKLMYAITEGQGSFHLS